MNRPYRFRDRLFVVIYVLCNLFGLFVAGPGSAYTGHFDWTIMFWLGVVLPISAGLLIHLIAWLLVGSKPPLITPPPRY